MTGITKVTIQENVEELKSIMNRQVLAEHKDKVRVLYWLQSGQCSEIAEIANLLAKNRSTIHRWLAKYQDRGITSLLDNLPDNTRKKHSA